MAFSESFAGHVQELLAELGDIRLKRMFGGAGVYLGDRMFGLIVGENLYLKTDAENRAVFEVGGAEPFIFTGKDGRATALSYWRLPDQAADDPEEALRWARLAVDAAMRAKAPKASKGTREDIGSGPWDQAG